MARLPLTGLRILDLSRLLPGPFATLVLADLGADVVKIEDPRGGDPLRLVPPAPPGAADGASFQALNRNKRSLALDLKLPSGRDAFLEMAAKADVVVESFRPGVMDKLGVGYAQLARKNPKIIVCSISGYGQTGPYVERAGHDLDYIALAGVLAMSGERGGAPAMPHVQIADLAGGALWGATAVLGALVGRDRTGKGAHLDISMTEGALALLAAELANLELGAHPTRGKELLNGGLAGYNVYRTADGRYLAVGALEPKFYVALNAALGRAGNIAEIAGDAEQHAKVRAEIAAIFATKPSAEWLEILAKHDCCVELVVEPDELPAHPLHRAREVFFPLEGSVTQVRTPVGMPRDPRRAPQLGEHTREVLAEYGFDDAAIAALAKS